ncbi:MAG: hypothetical protein ACO1TE_07120 [Prosthecobacter sp.]
MLIHPSSPIIRCLRMAALLGLCAHGGVMAQETIQIGPLKPLETLPSLGPSFVPGPPPGAEGKRMEGLPPGLEAPGLSVPGAPGLSVPAMPAPATAPAPPASPATSVAPPPLPAAAPAVITEPLAQAYLYMEPYQTRFEVLFDAASTLKWLTPDAPEPAELSAELQEQVQEKAALRAAEWCALTSSGEVASVPQVQVSVIKGLPAKTLPMKEGEAVPLNQAMVGFIWEFATPPAPAEVLVTWKGWINGRTVLPVKVFFGKQSEAGEINSTMKTFRWRNLDRLPRPAPLASVPQWEQPDPVRVPVGGIIWLLGGLVFYAYLRIKDHRLPGGSTPFVAVWLLGAVLMSQLLVVPVSVGPSKPRITEVADAQRIVSPLLRNVYRAFDHRAESDVYDVLERSVEGDLLRRLYLETIQALTLEGREGTRVTITKFQVTVDKVGPNPAGEGFVADCNWMAEGNVGHWGHNHTRLNIYNARLTLVPAKEEWKLTGLEVQEVRRL